jgi:uncharacterized membrane protein YeaQ/YmgE (transglycosylase-associated protein family)
MGVFLWVLVIGFVAGMVARLLSPGPNNPKGFVLTVVLGVAGAFLSTVIGQAAGFYRVDQGAGFIGATVGALVILFIWNRLVVSGSIRDHGV